MHHFDLVSLNEGETEFKLYLARKCPLIKFLYSQI